MDTLTAQICFQAECVWMYDDTGRAGMWDDAACGASSGYICKMAKGKQIMPDVDSWQGLSVVVIFCGLVT